MTRSYIIDDVVMEYDKDFKRLQVDFSFSTNSIDLQINRAYLTQLQNEYLKRISREESDCLSLIESSFDIACNIRCKDLPIHENDDKISIPTGFVDIYNSSDYTFDNLIESTLRKINGDSIFTYIKFYSPIGDCYYGGNYLKSQSDNPDVMKVISNAGEAIVKSIFIEDDVILDRKKQFFYNEKSILKNKKYTKNYWAPISELKNFDIKSEIHFQINYRKNLFGFINLHFSKTLSENEKDFIQNLLQKELNDFSIKALAIYNLSLIHI